MTLDPVITFLSKGLAILGTGLFRQPAMGKSGVFRCFSGHKLWAGLFILTGCLQGPWDYYPETPEEYRGLWVTGYIIAGQPVDDFCIERLLTLKEEYTNAYNYYRSAEVTIAGEFGTATNITLQPHPENVNCFVGPADALPVAGEEYTLQATLTWDSSGQTVTSTLSAVAAVPEQFEVRDTASMPSLAVTGLNLSADSGSFQNILDAFESLSMEAQEKLREIVVDSAVALFLAGDTAAAFEYFLERQDEINEVLDGERSILENEGTAFYLTSIFNTQSHNFSSVYSEDVGGALITQSFNDSTGSKPETAFDSIFGVPLDTGDFYQPGNKRRLLFYTKFTTPSGGNVLDSMGVVNTWYFTGLNRLYFYGFEKAYADFVETAIFQANNSSVKPIYNISGAAGIFAGAVVDSFDVNIEVDSVTKIYPLYLTHIADCREKGWEADPDCRAFYPEFCEKEAWEPEDCATDWLRVGYQAGISRNTDSLQTALEIDADEFRRLDQTAQRHFCIQNNFPDSVGFCPSIYTQCNGANRTWDCKQDLWNYCLDKKWDGEQCRLGMVSYCLDREKQALLLVERAEAFCEENQSATLCREWESR